MTDVGDLVEVILASVIIYLRLHIVHVFAIFFIL